MKPENISQDLISEQLPVEYSRGVEKTSNIDSPESGIETGADRFEQQAEAKAIIADVGLTTGLSAPVMSTAAVDDPTASSANPLIANDDDLIEKEWVDKAKKIVAQTQNDPHLQEKEVSELQVDYIKKRFGRELGVAE